MSEAIDLNIAMGIDELINKKVPPREPLCGNWLKTRELAMIYAYRGVGKTWFCMSLAYCLAYEKSFLAWPIHRNCRVLYMDWEMGIGDLKDRSTKIILGHDVDPEDGKRFSLIPVERLTEKGQSWNLTTERDRISCRSHMSGFDVIILDNLSCFMRPERGNETEVQMWGKINSWLIELRNEGKTIIIVHHAGKNKMQRGASNKEDQLNTTVSLVDTSSDNETKFDVVFEKYRSIVGDERRTYTATLNNKGDSIKWSWESQDERQRKDILELQDAGIKNKVISEVLGIELKRVIKLSNQSEAQCKLRIGDDLF